MTKNSISTVTALLFTLIFCGSGLLAANPTPFAQKTADKSGSSAAPERIPPDQIDSTIAGMSDEQVRRLLLEELKDQAEKEARAKSESQKPEGLTGFVQAIRDKSDLIIRRIDELKSGMRESPSNIPAIFTFLGQGQKDRSLARPIITVLIVFVAGFLIEWGLRRYWAGAMRRIESTVQPGFFSKIGALFLRALLDLVYMLLFSLAVLIVFYLFLERTNPQRVLAATYLAAILIVRSFHLVSRFILAPKTPQLRFLPLSDGAALYLHRWIMALALVATFGFLTCGIIRLAGASEESHFIAVTQVGLVIAAMVIWMIIQKRKPVGEAFAEGLPANSLRARLAMSWHYPATLFILFVLVFATINRLLGEGGRLLGLKTLLIVALYFLLDWLLKQVLQIAFGLAAKPDKLVEANRLASKADGGTGPQATPGIEEEDDEEEEDQTEVRPLPVNVHIDRMKRIIQGGLRLALAALLFLWTLSIWGVHFSMGTAVVDAVFDILMVVLISYVAWEVITAFIQRRLQTETPDTDEDMEEGGAGGSRMGTLLILLRKFLLSVLVVMSTLIILSSIGVEIGPLIAGAGVIGLAIGFGAQTLVKDILSGVFFLVDDAFRVGDYIEVAGAKGMVEHISLRSFTLRHPRGMVSTIPFGGIKTVTNFSRDYIVTKLDFRVRYDTDVDKVRKIIKKKVYKKLLQDPEIASRLLGKIKSSGVREMDDSAMIMRVKFKSVPGEQFMIRREVYRLMQEAFRKEGIEFAHRNVTVYMPPEVSKAIQEGKALPEEQKLEAAAAAAAAAVQAEDEARQAQEEKKKK